MATQKLRFDPAAPNCGPGFLFFPSLLSASHGVRVILRFSLHVTAWRQVLGLRVACVPF